jgi:hypothetical protein
VAGGGTNTCEACGGFGERCCGTGANQRTCDTGLRCSPPDGGGVGPNADRCY